MEKIAENSLSEYADVSCALIASNYILSSGDLNKTSQLVQNLFMHRVD